MEDIVAGRFETDDDARSAAASLADLVSESDIFIFLTISPAPTIRIGAPAINALRKAAQKGRQQARLLGRLRPALPGRWLEGLLLGQLRLLSVDIPVHSRVQQEVYLKKVRARIKLLIRGRPG